MVTYSDAHRVRIPPGWNAVDFAGQVLNHTPLWLVHLLNLRDKAMGRLGFATQPGSSRSADITVGGTAGPFVFSEVDPEVVRGGNRDSRIVFVSTFRVEHKPKHSHGVLETHTHSIDRLGALYLTIIWPAHKMAMGRILRSGMKGVRLDK